MKSTHYWHRQWRVITIAVEIPLKELEATKKDIKESKQDDKVVNQIMSKINKRFGEKSIGFYKDLASNFTLRAIPTQRISLNKTLGAIGGIPLGKITEIYGPEHTAKTGLLLGTIAEAQKIGLRCALVDAEHATENDYLDIIGVDKSKLLYCRPDSGEEALKIVEALVHSKEVDVIGVDSVASLSPENELSGEMGDSHMALQARLMSQAMRKLNAVASKNKVALIFLNQIRETMKMYGEKETTPGGKALKFYSSLRIELRRGSPIKNKQVIIGTEIKANIKKNRLGIPFQTCQFTVHFGKKFNPLDELHSLTLKFWRRGGGVYTLVDEEKNPILNEEGNEYKAVGKEGVYNLIKEDEKLVSILHKRLDDSYKALYEVDVEDGDDGEDDVDNE